jgi:hypothetical protein
VTHSSPLTSIAHYSVPEIVELRSIGEGRRRQRALEQGSKSLPTLRRNQEAAWEKLSTPMVPRQKERLETEISKPLIISCFSSAAGRNRTHDPVLRSFQAFRKLSIHKG